MSDGDTGVPPVVARLRRHAKDRQPPQVTVAMGDGTLLVRYGRGDLEWGEYLDLLDRAAEGTETEVLAANLDLVTRCCEQLMVRTETSDLIGLHEALGETEPYRIDERGLQVLEVQVEEVLAELRNPLRADTVRGQTLALFGTYSGAGLAQSVVGAHAEQVTHMMQGTSREVGAALLPGP